MESEIDKNQILRNVQELLEKQTKKGVGKVRNDGKSSGL